jgi:hypothetical protein
VEDHQVVATIATTLLASGQVGGLESERAHLEAVNIAHVILEMAKSKVEKEKD